MILHIVHIVGLSLSLNMKYKVKNKSCEECCCIDSEDNPIIEELNESGEVIKHICMMCYAESII